MLKSTIGGLGTLLPVAGVLVMGAGETARADHLYSSCVSYTAAVRYVPVVEPGPVVYVEPVQVYQPVYYRRAYRVYDYAPRLYPRYGRSLHIDFGHHGRSYYRRSFGFRRHHHHGYRLGRGIRRAHRFGHRIRSVLRHIHR